MVLKLLISEISGFWKCGLTKIHQESISLKETCATMASGIIWLQEQKLLDRGSLGYGIISG